MREVDDAERIEQKRRQFADAYEAEVSVANRPSAFRRLLQEWIRRDSPIAPQPESTPPDDEGVGPPERPPTDIWAAPSSYEYTTAINIDYGELERASQEAQRTWADAYIPVEE